MKMTRKPLFLTILCMLAALMLLNGCSSGAYTPPGSTNHGGGNTYTPAPAPTDSGGNTPAPIPTNSASSLANVVSGTVVDTQNNPIPNAEIIVDGIANASGAHEHYTTSTDASGAYSLTVAQGMYKVYAFDQVSYENAQWSLQLDPTDNSNDPLDSSNGITKNFQWKLAGQMPGTDGTNYGDFYGACVTVNLNIALVTVPAGATLSFTLTPNGPLIDGSTGQSVTFQRTQQDLSTPLGSTPIDHTSYLCAIPIGDYTISGQVTAADGISQTLLFDGNQSEEITWAGVSQPAEHVVNQIAVNITISGQ